MSRETDVDEEFAHSKFASVAARNVAMLDEIERLRSVNAELVAFVEEFIEAWGEGMAGDSYLLRLARAALASKPPAVEQKPVASIYISPNGEREFDDWKHDLPTGRNELYLGPQPEQVAQDADWFARWIRNNYQDHANISDLCTAMIEAARSGRPA